MRTTLGLWITLDGKPQDAVVLLSSFGAIDLGAIQPGDELHAAEAGCTMTVRVRDVMREPDPASFPMTDPCDPITHDT